MKVLVIASHSGGHIFPAKAFCDGLREKAGSITINFVTTDGELERKILPSNLNPIFFERKRISVFNSFELVKLYFQAKKIIKDLQPDLIAGFGGYLSVPFIICAQQLGIHNFIHEQNVVLGRANSFLANFAEKIIFSFPNSTASNRLKDKSIILGLPLKNEINIIDKEIASKEFDFNSKTFTILVSGGSQGSRNINNYVVNVLRQIGERDLQIIHITGFLDYERMSTEYKQIKIKYKVFPFFERMSYAYCASDLVICRAGANTLAELVSLRVPSILIPYPHAKAHQLENACFLEVRGAAIVLEDRNCSGDVLKNRIIDLKSNPVLLGKFKQGLTKIGTLDGRNQMVDFALNLIR